MYSPIFENDVLPGAALLGALCGIALVVVACSYRRGVTILGPYAVLISAVAILFTKYPDVSYQSRWMGGFAAFLVSTTPLYIAVAQLSARERLRQRRRREKVNPQSLLQSPPAGPSLGGHAWRIAVLLAMGLAVSAGVGLMTG